MCRNKTLQTSSIRKNSILSFYKMNLFLKYLSLNTLYDTANILVGHNFVLQFVALAIAGLACFVMGIIKFNTKDLPL